MRVNGVDVPYRMAAAGLSGAYAVSETVKYQLIIAPLFTIWTV